MTPEGGGYFVHRQPQVEEGLRYAFKLADGREYPDPASRWQPDGVHRPSAVFFPESYRWSDAAWRGVAREDLVIYELHVGTFTPEGTFDAIIPRLPQLLSLGVTAIELMPVAQFAGRPQLGLRRRLSLRRAEQLRRAAGAAAVGRRRPSGRAGGDSRRGLQPLRPRGKLPRQVRPLFHRSLPHAVGKGRSITTGRTAIAVRQFVIDNACMWVRDFHVDGLRLDAVHAIYDFGPRHILAEIQAAVQQEAARADRLVHVIAESNQNDVRLIRPQRARRLRAGRRLERRFPPQRPRAADRRARRLLPGFRPSRRIWPRRSTTCSCTTVVTAPFAAAATAAAWARSTARGSSSACRTTIRWEIAREGIAWARSLPPAAQRLACGLLLLSPCVPLLFMGEEYGEQRPFPFFCSFDDPAVVEAVRRGRREEFAALAFHWGSEIPDPQDPETFAAAKLDWAWPEGSPQAQLRQLYQDLLAARRRWPALRDRRHTAARAAERPAELDRIGDGQPALLVLQRGGDDGLLAVANLTIADACRWPRWNSAAENCC